MFPFFPPAGVPNYHHVSTNYLRSIGIKDREQLRHSYYSIPTANYWTLRLPDIFIMFPLFPPFLPGNQ